MLRTALALACLLLGLLAVPAAHAATPTQILRDCADDGVLQGTYSPSDLRRARQNIPADTDEYTDCRDVLGRALNAGVAGSGGGAGGAFGGGAFGGSGGLENLNTPEARAIVAEAAEKGAPDPLQLDGRPVIPGNAGLAAGAVRNGLPTTLIIVLALLGVAALATAAPYVRRSVLGRLGR